MAWTPCTAKRPGYCIACAWAEGAMAHIAVRDHGPGLSADAQRRLFEPFYTTKPAGEGAGPGAGDFTDHCRELRRRAKRA